MASTSRSKNTQHGQPRTERSIGGLGPKRSEIMVEDKLKTLIQTLGLNDKQVEEIRLCFELFDIQGTGTITGLELQKVAASVGRYFSDEDVNEILAEIDLDSNTNDEIDFIDFISIMGKSSKEPLQETDARHVFNVFDTNSDEFISPEDMHRVFLSHGIDLTAQELTSIFDEYDVDRDGMISYEELQPLIAAAHLRSATNDEVEKI